MNSVPHNPLVQTFNLGVWPGEAPGLVWGFKGAVMF